MRTERTLSGETIAGLNLLDVELEFLANNPFGNDERVGAFARATRELMHQDFDTRHILSEAVNERISKKHVHADEERTAQASYLARLLFSATQKQLLGVNGDPEYPQSEEYTQPEHWKAKIQEIVRDDSASAMIFKNDILHRELMSNIGQRYATLKLIMQAYAAERWEDGPQVLDVGCSLMMGHLMLLSPHALLEFKPITVYDNPQRSEQATDPNEELTKLIGGIAVADYCVKDTCHHTGVDIFEKLDDDTIAWAISNSRYPKELLSSKNYGQDIRSLLTDINSPYIRERLDYIQADFTENQDVRFGGRKYDVQFISTMMYQHTPEERHHISRNMMSLAADNGLIIVQDGAERDPNSDYLRYSAKHFSKKYEYRTYVMDMTQKDRGLQPFIDWSNGRCEEMSFFKSRFTLETLERLRLEAT